VAVTVDQGTGIGDTMPKGVSLFSLRESRSGCRKDEAHCVSTGCY